MDPQDSDKQDQQQQGNKRGSFKVKLGFFFGYNGEKFQGMQYQRQHTNTIQNILHSLLLENGFILKSNAHELKRIKWSRAARTDKRVHALCNGISMKIEINQKYVVQPGSREINYNRIIKDLNDQLPMDIRILVLRKVGKSFDMRHDAKTRIYNYIIPSRLFQQFAKFKENFPIEGEQLTHVLNKLNQLVKFYLGTHNFFNFTRGYKQTSPQCQRYMIKMFAQKVQQQTVRHILTECGCDEKTQYQSFIRFTLVGQSFIYHQIRKMIGLLIKIFSQDLNGEQTIKQAFKPQQFDVYLAPGEGLYLNRMTFESYNNRKDTKEKIEFTEEEEERIRKYRAYIQEKIIKHEIEEQIFSNWLLQRKDWENKQEEQEEKDEKQSEESNQNGNKGKNNKNRDNNRNRSKQKGKQENKEEKNEQQEKLQQKQQEGKEKEEPKDQK